MITGSLFLIHTCSLLLGLTAGFVMHRSDYCMAGMFRDAFLFKNTFMLRTLLLQIVITMAIFEIARLSGLLPLYPFPLLGFPSLANLAGGFLFGLGMVLAGGCVVGTLYKMGGGSTISLAAFLGLIAGSGLYAEMHPRWSAFMKATTFSQNYLTLPQLADLSPSLFVAPIVLAAALLFGKGAKKDFWQRPSQVRGYLQPWKTACTLALATLVSYLLLGMPLGITTTYAKMAAMLENLAAPGHVSRLPFYQIMSLDIVHPASGAVLRGGPGPRFDSIWAIQFPVIAGIVLGSMISAILLREFTMHARAPVRQYVMACCGGIILGLASRMSPACNIWHLMGGLPILALQSLLFLLGLIPGSWAGSKIITFVILRQRSGPAG
ncbi:MAG: YeeE/YedE family protein [Deltaproteobacteria bacterium]|nr:YeeE/YedE family protein [Deltaproteobacteria bacterium]